MPKQQHCQVLLKWSMSLLPVITVGEYFDSYADFKSDLDTYRQENVTDATLMSYIDMLLSSSDYFTEYGSSPIGGHLRPKENTKILVRTVKVSQDSVSLINQGKPLIVNFIRHPFECLTIGEPQILHIGEFAGRGTEST